MAKSKLEGPEVYVVGGLGVGFSTLGTTQVYKVASNTYDLGEPLGDDYHVFAVQWQPNRIVWYVDGVQYFAATPTDAFLQGKSWVFNHPFFMLMNVAVGGNFGGPVGPDAAFPQNMSID